MSSDSCSRILVAISHFLFVMTTFVATPSSSAQTVADLTASGTKSSYRDTFMSSRHRRAPGWGKRDFEKDDLIDESEMALGEMKNNDIFREVVLFSPETSLSSEKRAPGWGKRAPGWGKRAPGWGKRAPGWGKRAPGWGKRSCPEGGCFSGLNSIPHLDKTTNDELVLIDEDDDDDMENVARSLNKRAPGWGKREFDTEGADMLRFLSDNEGESVELLENADKVRELLNRISSMPRVTLSSQDTISAVKKAPGWGKRNQLVDFNEEGIETDKRAPGWGKRAPGWGKRAPGWGKRAPGWGKRAPGWGKRSDVTELDDDLSENNKRAPGWGKRAPGWGKRAPGWGKRAPGWGKRSDVVEFDDELSENSKRAPGWGKRAPGWGKRAPGWGKRSVSVNCQDLQNIKDEINSKVVTGVSGKCGNSRDSNEPSRK